jgi:hypothetical protein
VNMLSVKPLRGFSDVVDEAHTSDSCPGATSQDVSSACRR